MDTTIEIKGIEQEQKLKNLLNFPFDSIEIIQKKKAIKRALCHAEPLIRKNIAILGGSTTSEIKDILDIFLLFNGIEATFYESSFNCFYEDGAFPNQDLENFKPDFIYLHTTNANILHFPKLDDPEIEVEKKLEQEWCRYQTIWNNIKNNYSCSIIQNNFELPLIRPLGNLDFSESQGKTHFVMSLNSRLATYAKTCNDFYINDIHFISSWIGLANWFDPKLWHAYRYALSFEAIPHVCHNIAAIINAILGNAKKCLVVDLDNTLWGGVIGDDGLSGIQIGKETALGDAYYSFQEYLLELKKRGIILSICSKNDEVQAREGISHPNNALHSEDFSVIKANWSPKNQNIIDIAHELNIGLDALVFIDDNPMERDIVRQHLSQVTVPDIGDEIALFVQILDRSGYFEPATLSKEDFLRTKIYEDNKKRKMSESHFMDYNQFLASLEMASKIESFNHSNIERVFQLINKTNQFNLTTKRFTLSEILSTINNDQLISLSADLNDKFGNNGIVSVILGELDEKVLHINLWLMSCRVIKRNLEFAMFDVLVEKSIQKGLKKIYGYYYKSSKNDIVQNHYHNLGFTLVKKTQSEDSIWEFKLNDQIRNKNSLIKVII